MLPDGRLRGTRVSGLPNSGGGLRATDQDRHATDKSGVRQPAVEHDGEDERATPARLEKGSKSRAQELYRSCKLMCFV